MMKKVFFSFAIVAAGLLVASCGNKSDNNVEGTDSTAVAETNATTEENEETEAQPSADPLQRDFESSDLSVTIPEGWTGEVGVFDEITMTTKGENGFDPKIEVLFMKERDAKELIGNDMNAYDLVKTEGVKIGGYTFTTLLSESSKHTKGYAQVGEDVLRVTATFINIDAPEVASVIESIKLK